MKTRTEFLFSRINRYTAVTHAIYQPARVQMLGVVDCHLLVYLKVTYMLSQEVQNQPQCRRSTQQRLDFADLL